MAFLDSFKRLLVGGPTDPYERDRAMRENLMQRSMADYDRAMSQPLGFISPEMKAQMMTDAEQNVRNMNPGAGQSGFVNDRIARAQNDVNMRLAQTNLAQADKQRQYIQQLASVNQPMGPEQSGLVQQIGGQMASQAGNKLGGMAVDYAAKKIGGWMGGGQPEIQGVAQEDEDTFKRQGAYGG